MGLRFRVIYNLGCCLAIEVFGLSWVWVLGRSLVLVLSGFRRVQG